MTKTSDEKDRFGYYLNKNNLKKLLFAKAVKYLYANLILKKSTMKMNISKSQKCVFVGKFN
jgi:hypothetical protein